MVKKVKTVKSGELTAEVYTLSDGHGEADILTYGGRIVRLTAPDKNGRYENVIEGPGTCEDYLTYPGYYGALIGRFGNRIGGARFTLNGDTYVLEANERGNTLHGGFAGFDKKVWQARVSGDALILTLSSPHLEGGYPGNLTVTVTYTYDGGVLGIDYEAASDRDTVLNLTNHAYFRLGGDDITGHRLTIDADAVTEVDDELIPTGTLLKIAGTPLAFRDKPVGRDIQCDHPLIRQCSGYDFNYCLAPGAFGGDKPAATLYEPVSGRRMTVYTCQPAVQLYTSNGEVRFGDKTLKKYNSLCLETQGFPDAPNHPAFPSAVLRAGETYKTRTEYRFDVVDENV